MAFQSKHSWDRACPTSDGSDRATYYKSYDPGPRMAAPRCHITLAVGSRRSFQEYKRSWTTLEFIIILRFVCFEMLPPPQSLFGSNGDDNLLICMPNLNERVFSRPSNPNIPSR